MATTTDYATTPLLGVNLQQVFTPGTTAYPYTPDYPPMLAGTIIEGTDGTSYVYVSAAAALAAGDVATITSAFAAQGVTTTNAALGNQLGVALVAIASGSYGWLQRLGACPAINVVASCLPNVQLAATTTAGTIDDAVTTGTKNLTGIVILATNTASATASKAGMLNWPVVGSTN